MRVREGEGEVIYDDASFTFNGVTVPMTDVNYSAKKEPDYGIDLSAFIPKVTTFETTVPIVGGFDAFARLLRNDPPGASATTLAKRVAYGGRKGRSAMRRLYARALPVEMSTADGLRFHGRAVMFGTHDIRIRMSQRSGRGAR